MSTSQNIYQQISTVENLILSNSDNFVIDQELIKIFYNGKTPYSSRRRESWLSKHPILYNYLVNRYKDSKSLRETLYRIYNNIETIPTCPICGKDCHFNLSSGVFTKCCCKKCADLYIKEKREKTLLEKYGVINSYSSKEIQERIKNTLIKKYGVDSPLKSKEIQEKAKLTCVERYGETNPMKNKNIQEKSKKTCLEKYNSEYFLNSSKRMEELKKFLDDKEKLHAWVVKCTETKKKQKSFGKSKGEEICFNLLLTKFPNTKRQYHSEKYPFACDFYIPEKDLYIELQGMWTHGPHAYNSNDPNDINLVEKWKSKNTEFYNSAIEVWTVYDPLKRELAKKNNLNWIEFWNIEEFKQWFNKIKEEN